jgi:small GTP-binding protein
MSSGPSPTSTEAATADRLEEWAEFVRATEGLSNRHGDLAQRAQRLAERIEASRYHIAVLGDFKRGKSTLINALVGQAVLPTGVVPLTTVATEVNVGGTAAAVVLRDGTRFDIDPDQIADFVSEQANPSNAKGVERVEVGVEADFGTPGLVLVDTPGFSSVNESNTAEANHALTDADGAIVVLAADNPLSKTESDTLELLAERKAHVFIVINRCDTLAPAELEEVRRFVTNQVVPILEETSDPFCISARNALANKQNNSGDALEFEEFRAALSRFIEDDLDGARRAAVAAEFGRLGEDLAGVLDLEEAADAMDMTTLDRQIAELTRSVDEGRRQLEEDIALLGHDVDAMVADVGRELTEQASVLAQECAPELAASLDELPRNQLDRGASDAIEDLIRSHFEPLRADLAEQVEGQWTIASDRFTDRVHGQLNRVVETASALFSVHLPQADVPELRAQRGRFSYYFSYAESQNAVVGRALGHLVPSVIARPRTLRRATKRLAEEFDKHAGRARYDFAERLRDAKDVVTASMASEFDRTQASLVAACLDAREVQKLGQAARNSRADIRAQLRVRLARVAEVVGGEQG